MAAADPAPVSVARRVQIISSSSGYTTNDNPIMVVNWPLPNGDPRTMLAVGITVNNTNQLIVLNSIAHGDYNAMRNGNIGVRDADLVIQIPGSDLRFHFEANPQITFNTLPNAALRALPDTTNEQLVEIIRAYNTLTTRADDITTAIANGEDGQLSGTALGGRRAVAVAGAGARERPRPAVVRRFRAAVGNDNVQTFNGLRTARRAVDVAETFIGTDDDAENARQFVPDLFAKLTKAAYDRMKQDVVANAGQITAWKELAVAATEGSPLAGYARLFTPEEVDRLIQTNGGSMNPGDGVQPANQNTAYRVLERLYVKGNKIVIHARRPYVWKKKHYDFLDLPTETGAHPKFVSCINEIGLTAEEITILTGGHAVATPLVILKYYILRTHPYFKRWMRDQGRATRVQNQVRKARGVAESKRGEVYAKVAAKIGTRTNAVKRATNKALRGVFAATKRQRTDVATCAMAV